MKDFTHLECHSNFSLLFGASPAEELVEECVRSGMGSLALTDRDGLYGAVPFFEAARSAGIKPIIGCDLAVEGPPPHPDPPPPGGRGEPGESRLILLARDEDGYRNLSRLVTERTLGESPLGIESLAAGAGGLFALCSEPGLLATLSEAFGDSLFALLVNEGTRASHAAAEALIPAARRHGVRCVAGGRVAFARAADYDLHRVLCAIRLLCPVTRIPAGGCASAECHLKPPGAIAELFSAHPYSEAPEALPNTAEIAAACDFRFELGRWLFPAPDLPAGESAFSHLTKLCFEGAAKRYRPLTTRALERLHLELDTIEALGFTPYFLVVNEIARFCRERDIPAAGRGSAAGSMVAYVLGITYIDPLEHDLYFERFLSPARDDPPDIDLDVSASRRDEVLSYIYRRFGRDRVAMICTYATMKARQAVRDVGKAMGLPPEEVDAFSAAVPRCRASDIEKVAGAIPSYRGLPADREPYRTILDMAARLDGFPRHISIHVGGVVIADRPLTDLVPLERAAKGLVVTQYDMGPIERLGLIKMDILGQKGLSVIEDTAAGAAANHGARLDTDDLPRDDEATFRLLRSGRTLGVFQIESPAMRSLLQAMQVRDISELTLSIALIRPGASGSGMKELFLLRRAGREPLVYLHPDLEPILSESLGTFVYQEQVMRAAVALAGFTLEEADGLRRAMTKHRSPGQMDALRARFMTGAVERGLSTSAALAVYESLARFSGYGFCKAHAATYGEFSYQAAYLKAHFPAEFMASVLTNDAGFYHRSVYIEEARRLGVPVALPDINRSGADFEVHGGVLYFGLRRVKGLTFHTVEKVLEARERFPFTSLSDFLSRVTTTGDEVATLIKCGAFDSFENTRPELLWKLSMMWAQVRSGRPHPGSPDGEDGPDGSSPLPLPLPRVTPPTALPRLPDYSPAHRLRLELEYLEAGVSRHPLEIMVPGELARATVNSSTLADHLGETVTLVGWLIAQRRAVTRKREYMQFLTCEDLTGTFEATIFPREYERLGALVGTSRILRVTGRVSDRAGGVGLIACDLEPIVPSFPDVEEAAPPPDTGGTRAA
ncbi:MAG: DNA polymerase III subunit alpha [Actinobacteria bacterium]|nr:DNA polymerase III subunit alpha [Actinomycetota bacterium]MBU2688847.1 DNA polymerase III subunit alpha [Actinomycetota bacterium]